MQLLSATAWLVALLGALSLWHFIYRYFLPRGWEPFISEGGSGIYTWELSSSLRFRVLAGLLLATACALYPAIMLSFRRAKSGWPKMGIYLCLAVLGLTLFHLLVPTPVMTGSRQKAAINNLRQIAAAGMDYCQSENVESVSYPKLVGDYFSPLYPIYGEVYYGLVVHREGGTLRVKTVYGWQEQPYGAQPTEPSAESMAP